MLVYAPTNDSRSEVNEHFRIELHKVTEEVGRKETLMAMGDLNAGVGRDSEMWGSVIGRHGEEVRNESGEQLLRFCAVKRCWSLTCGTSPRIFTNIHGCALAET